MKKIIALLLSCIMLLCLCACGSSAKYAATDTAAAMPMEAPATAEEYSDAYCDEMGFASASGTTNALAGKTDADLSTADTIDPDKIIYSATATVETTDFDKTVADLNAMIEKLGGFIQSSSLSGSNYYAAARGYTENRYADYTIRIPSEHFATVMNSLSSLGSVPYSYTYSENISAQYYDTQARLEAYKAQETRLVEMMAVAETVEDIITIEDRLTELRYNIESLQSTMNNWDRQVSYSTVSLSVQEVQIYTPEAGVSYGEQLALAFREGLVNAGSFFKQLLIDVLSILPALVFIAIVAVIVTVAVRKRRAKKRAAKAAETSEEQAK